MAGVLRNRPDCKVGIDIGEQEMIDGGNPKALVDHVQNCIVIRKGVVHFLGCAGETAIFHGAAKFHSGIA